MRIGDVLKSGKVENKTKNTDTIKNNSIIKSLFSAEMLQQENEADRYKQEIEELRKEIEIVGDSIEKEPTIPNFQHFRNILSRLAKRINSEAYRLEKCGGTPQNPRYYEIITTIDFEADALYNLIIREQKNNMAITAKVICIKGLVVDLIS